MKKICLTLGMLTLCSVCYAQATPDLTGRVKSLEDRVTEIENELKVLKAKKQGGPLNQANMSDEELKKWATDSIALIYTYDFANVEQTLAHLRHRFTAPGYDSFLQALKDSGNLKFVQDKKLVVNAVANGPTRIENQGPTDTLYTWRVAVPLHVTYQSSLEKFSQNIIVSMDIVRVNTDASESGVAINSVNASVAPKAGQTSEEKAPTEKTQPMPEPKPAPKEAPRTESKAATKVTPKAQPKEETSQPIEPMIPPKSDSKPKLELPQPPDS